MRETIYIIDGHSQIFRAYFSPAARGRSVRGRPVGAVYVFTRMLIRLIKAHEPDYLVCTLDPRGGTFRNKIFPEYKANRDAMPEDLQDQMPLIVRMIEAFRIPIQMVDGFEADDVIGTLCVQAEKAGMNVRLVSRDKDLKQLLTDRVLLLSEDDDSLYGVDDLEDEHGITPAQMIDLLALAGDTADNIPGAKGIGPKTAAQLLQKYGTLTEVLAHADEVKQPKRRENLIAFREHADLSRRLTTICLDVPGVSLRKQEAKLHPPEKKDLLPLLAELNFKSVVHDFGWDGEELAAAPAAAAVSEPAGAAQKSLFGEPAMVKALAAPKKSRYTLVETVAEFRKLTARLAGQKRLALHCVTDDGRELVGIAFALKPGDAAYVSLTGKELRVAGVLDALKPVLTDAAVAKIGHDLKREMRLLYPHGIELEGIESDTRLDAYLIDSSREDAKLASLSREFLGRDCVNWDGLFGEKKKRVALRDAPAAAVLAYAAEFVDFALQVSKALAPQLKKLKLLDLAEKLEIPLIRVLARMETRGIRIDLPYLKRLGAKMAKQIEKLETACHKLAGREFKIGSPKQLSEILFDELGLPEQGKTAKGTGRSTDVGSLEKLKDHHQLPGKVLEWRHLSKLKSTYVDQLPLLADDEQRVHTTFRQTVATGRLSSKDPNVQNIPVRTDSGKQIRKAFIAAEGFKLISADYSQIELRVLAHISGEPSMITAFKRGVDIHTVVAAGLFGMKEDQVTSSERTMAKTVNYGVLYGQSAFGLSQTFGIPRAEAKKFIDDYFGSHPKVKALIEKTLADCRKNGYVTTLLGRRRYLKDIRSRNAMQRAAAERQAFNTVLQGTAADLIKRAMLDADAEVSKKKLPYRMLLQVHDELVFEAPAAEAEACAEFAKRIMRNALKMKVPLDVDAGIGDNWLEAK